jgi:hypothetical protein
MTKPSPTKRGLATSISLRGSIADQMCGSPTICKDHVTIKVGVSDPGSFKGETVSYDGIRDPREHRISTPKVGRPIPGAARLLAGQCRTRKTGIENQ